MNTTTSYQNSNIQIIEGQKDPILGFRKMRIMAIEYQQHHVKVNLCIQGEILSFTALLDSGADVNILNSKVIPAKYWISAKGKVVGLGNKTLRYEVPKASIGFDQHCIKLKFAISDIPVDWILGNIFLAAVEPHGSIRLKNNKAGYFIIVPTSYGKSKRIEMPYITSPRISTMVQTIRDLDRAEAKLTDLKDLKSSIQLEEQLKNPLNKRKIAELKRIIEEECCSEEPNAFWYRKQHTVDVPYKTEYTGNPCKSRAIPMNKEYRDLCEKEIKQRLNRRLIRESDSPWHCYGFYVNKKLE